MRILRSLPIFGVAAAALFAATEASAVLSVVSQTRTVGASAYAENYNTGENDSENVSYSAPDNGPFVQGAGAGASIPGGDSSASGTQNSTLGANVLHAVGTCGMYAESYDYDVEASCSGSSVFDVTFDVPVSASYTLAGFISAYDNGGTSITFSGPSGALYDDGAGNNEVFFDESGTLEAGEYRLRVSTSGGAYANNYYDYASGDYNVTLTVESTIAVESLSWGEVKAAYR